MTQIRESADQLAADTENRAATAAQLEALVLDLDQWTSTAPGTNGSSEHHT
jgi:hypothetical protein